MDQPEVSQLEMKCHPRWVGKSVICGSEEWRQSFFDWAYHLKTYFQGYAAKLTEAQRRELASSMGLPVADPFAVPAPVPDEVVTRLQRIHDIAGSADRGTIQLEIRNVLTLLAGRAEGRGEQEGAK
jgi:hypothetical protein